MNQSAIIVPMIGSATARRTSDPVAILNSVCHEGWELVSGSFVFLELGQQSRDKFMSSVQIVGENPSLFNLGPGEIDRQISSRSHGRSYGTLVKACNDTPTLYRRTITVTAVSDNGGVASASWHEVEYDQQTDRARWEAMQEALVIRPRGRPRHAGPEHLRRNAGTRRRLRRRVTCKRRASERSVTGRHKASLTRAKRASTLRSVVLAIDQHLPSGQGRNTYV
jgi:hypothetical protein